MNESCNQGCWGSPVALVRPLFPTGLSWSTLQAAPNRYETWGNTVEHTDPLATRICRRKRSNNRMLNRRPLSCPSWQTFTIITYMYLGLVHPSPSSSKMVISLGERFPRRKSTVSLDRWGEIMERTSSGLPQLCSTCGHIQKVSGFKNV